MSSSDKFSEKPGAYKIQTHLKQMEEEVPLCHTSIFGCGSKIGAQNGTLVTGNMDYNMRSPYPYPC